MPYITQRRRDALVDNIEAPETAGELNYLFTKCINQYRHGHSDSYATFNDVLGALEGAKQEFYRRVVVPYEDKQREANGDVYD